MKRHLILIAAWLLANVFLAIIGAQEWRERPLLTLDQQQMFERAVEKAQRCGVKPEKTVLQDGKEKVVPIEESEAKFARKLEVKVLFKRWRFELRLGVDSETPEKKPLMAVLFEPWLDEGRQLKAEQGQSENTNNVLNRLRGVVLLDRETESIVRIDGNLSDNVWLKKGGIPGVNLLKVGFSYVQTKQGGEWIPDHLNANAEIWSPRLLVMPEKREYKLPFSCGM